MEIPRVNNFGLLRYVMAFSIVAGHYNFLAGGSIPVPLSAYDCVGGFFVLSGFFVCRSYADSRNMVSYVKRRARRLLPPYLLVVLACALGLSVVSQLSPVQYFTSGEFRKYLAANLTFLNFLQPDLPGVFTTSPMAAVNASLWTLKEEWMLYFLYPALLWAAGRLRMRLLTALALVYVCSVLYRAGLTEYALRTGSELFATMSRQVFGCMSFFFTGVALRQCFGWLRRHRLPLLAAGAALFALSYSGLWCQILLRPAAIGLVLIILGTTGRWGHWAATPDNVSYEIYLFHFPVIQLAVHFGLPDTLGSNATFGLVALTVTVLAVASWFALDKPMLRRNRNAEKC